MLWIEAIKDKLCQCIINFTERSERRIYIEIEPASLLPVAEFLFKQMGLRFATASAVDTPKGIEILYHFSYDLEGTIVSVRVLLNDKKNLQISSLAGLIRGAEWIEREMWELLGINFVGHPNLKHLLLKDDWPEGNYPLRKDKKE